MLLLGSSPLNAYGGDRKGTIDHFITSGRTRNLQISPRSTSTAVRRFSFSMRCRTPLLSLDVAADFWLRPFSRPMSLAEFSNWLDPTPRSASPTVEAATDLRILLHKVCQKWPLTTPWAYEASVALGIVLFPCWDATPPFRIAHTCWTPPKNLHACLRGIETVLSCEGLPERGTEMEKAVDLDWTAAGAGKLICLFFPRRSWIEEHIPSRSILWEERTAARVLCAHLSDIPPLPLSTPRPILFSSLLVCF